MRVEDYSKKNSGMMTSDRMFGFEKLVVWGEMRKLIQAIYLLTVGFPANEKFGLISQIRRSAYLLLQIWLRGHRVKASKTRRTSTK
jgi:hypothetical protein